MRILKLTDGVAARFIARHLLHDADAEKVAARIVGEVRRNGDAGLFRWSQRLDRVRLMPNNLWIPRSEMSAARRDVPRDLLRAIEHAARNIRRVAEKQLPQPWSVMVEPGVRVASA